MPLLCASARLTIKHCNSFLQLLSGTAEWDYMHEWHWLLLAANEDLPRRGWDTLRPISVLYRHTQLLSE